MKKINTVDLKGFKLILERGKERYDLATLDAVSPPDNKKPENKVLLHLVQGNKWTGEIVADLPENRVLLIKGSIYSRNSAMKSNESIRVGQI